MTIAAIAAGDKKGGSSSSWSKVKFDRQIVAIAKVNGADTIYSTDDDVARFGRAAEIKVESVWDLPEPQPEQINIPYDEDEKQTTEPPAVGVLRGRQRPSEGQATAEAETAEGEEEEAPS